MQDSSGDKQAYITLYIRIFSAWPGEEVEECEVLCHVRVVNEGCDVNINSLHAVNLSSLCITPPLSPNPTRPFIPHLNSPQPTATHLSLLTHLAIPNPSHHTTSQLTSTHCNPPLPPNPPRYSRPNPSHHTSTHLNPHSLLTHLAIPNPSHQTSTHLKPHSLLTHLAIPNPTQPDPSDYTLLYFNPHSLLTHLAIPNPTQPITLHPPLLQPNTPSLRQHPN
ncbi:hypothetical protein Pcinc_042487 [Petrolisthes cinctipes]|uniref:Uncharacterized protein n=1 Tax=Petrolisthes cinctipes TaxID=88211 RepID=A0AAE1BIQ8_PETCI|nr:hypothetical protein Pcinc_042487 [Petrolisthes cinctipes]